MDQRTDEYGVRCKFLYAALNNKVKLGYESHKLNALLKLKKQKQLNKHYPFSITRIRTLT